MTDHQDKTLAVIDNETEVSGPSIGHSLSNYFGNIYEALWTVFVGLRITIRAFFESLIHRPVTVLYPEVNMLDPWDENDPEPLSHQVSERYRGFLFNDIENCTSCGVCRTACPVDCIKVEGQKYPEVKGLVLKQYDIDYALCIYCGLCVEVCPTNCLTFQRAFENPVDDLKLLYRTFVTEEDHQRMLEKAPRKPAKPEKPAVAAKPAASSDSEPASPKTPIVNAKKTAETREPAPAESKQSGASPETSGTNNPAAPDTTTSSGEPTS